MADIAKIGFSANTGDLKDAKAALDALKPSATSAAAGVDKFNRAAAGVTVNSKGAATGIKSFDAVVTGVAGSTDRLSRTALAAGTAMGTVERAAVGAGAPLANLVTQTVRVDAAFVSASAKARIYETTLKQIAPAAGAASSSLNRLGAAANDNINRLQSTPGNVAAQFQDIGVTAAAGMDPLLIALQQGTQLSAAMAGGLGNLIAGLKQVFSPATLLTIVIVALIAYLIQWGMEALSTAKNHDVLKEAITSVQSTTYALGDAQSILGNVMDLTTGKINTQTAALISLARAQLAAGRIKAINDQAEARSAMTDIRRGSVQLQAGFGGGLNVTRVGDGTQDIVTRFAKGVNTADQALAQLENRLAGGSITEKAFLGAADAITKFGVAVENEKVFKDAQRLLNGDTSGTGYLLTPDDPRKPRTARKPGKSEAEKAAERYDDLIKKTQAHVVALGVEANALGMTNNAAHLYRIEQELIAQAVDKGIKLTAEQTAELKGLAATISKGELNNAFRSMLKDIQLQERGFSDAAEQIGKYGLELEYIKQRQALMNEAVDGEIIDLSKMTEEMRLQVAMLENRAAALAEQSENNRYVQFVEDMTRAHQENMTALQRERGELGLTGAALEAYRYETDLLNSAMRDKRPLTEQDIALIREQAAEYGVATEAIRKQREQLEFYRNTFKGFFTSLLDGLRQGQSAWEAFGNAVMSVVNKIIDRLMDNALDSLFAVLPKLLGIAAPQARLVGSATNAINSNPGFFADGAAFDSSGVTRFAKGGAFTNGVYSSPTLFKFANGGAFGEMGEAGPEAVMPLKRGSDGSLGVQVHASQPIHVVVTANDDRFNAYVDDRADVRVATHAPTIANAGANVANRTASFKRSRVIGS